MNSTKVSNLFRAANYHVIIPLSLICILITIIIAFIILGLVIFIKRLHTVTNLLVCNGSIASIFYCIVQCINYIFLAFIPWETSDFSCRWRGFFGYMTVAAIVYSYLTQAISRFFVSIVCIKYPWAISIKAHIILIFIQWIIVICLPLPALLTEDIYYRPFSLCWVPEEYTLHSAYTIIAYYVIPAIFIFAIYIYIYIRVKRRKNRVFVTTKRYRSNPDLELLYNIMILFTIYIFGALPTIVYMITKIEVFYTIGIISVSLCVAIEKFVTLIVDRDFRNIIKNYICRSITQVEPII
jgi:hypothetical protein